MLLLTLPIIFEYTNLVSPFALIIIFTAMLGIFYISAPSPEPVEVGKPDEHQGVSEHQDYQKFFPFLYQAWYGNLPLWKVFWPYFILVNVVLYASDRAVKNAVLSVATWDNILIICICSALWWGVGVWRMSAHCHYRLYSASARLLTLAVFFDFFLRIFINIKYPRIFFNCDTMLLDYSSCF